MTVTTALSAFYAFSVLPLAQTYALLFAAPLLITLLSIPLLGERVGPRRLIAVLVGLIGVLVVLRPAATTFTLGHLAGVTAAFCGALGALIVRKIGRDERSAVLLLYPMLANIAVMGAALPFVYRPMPLDDLAALAAIAVLAFVGTTALIMAYRRGTAVIVAPMQYSQILWAAIYGAVFFAEIPAWTTLAGALIIIAAGIYIVLREDSGVSSENQPVLSTKSRHDTGLHPRVGTLLARQRAAEPEGAAEALAKPTASD